MGNCVFILQGELLFQFHFFSAEKSVFGEGIILEFVESKISSGKGMESSSSNMTKRERIALEVTKSLRPKAYQRKTLLSTLTLNDEDRFHANAFETIKNGTFTDIHLRMQSEKYER